MKKLPIGIQSFEDLRSNNYLYVDKTEFIHRIVSEGKVYFLSRPRRFGKSLLISTLDALFKGRKELFKGLHIYNKWDWTQQYPVIRIDWSQITFSSLRELKLNIIDYLKEIALKYQITIEAKSATIYFRKLINALHEKTGKQVVILIDEYDSTIIDHLFDPKLDNIRKVVHDFYRVMKGADEYLKFIFLTGVSKFSGLSIFSALNNPDDITLSNRYVSICGYTQEELESNFLEYIDSAAEYLKMTREYLLDRIRYWYNGYTWDGKTAVYNPFSTLKFFKEQRFAGYWFRTGTPTFLIDMLQRRSRTDVVLKPVVVGDNVFDGYDPANISEVPLLFQTGYLTIKQMELIDGVPRYTLGVPNSEVNDALLTCLLLAYGKYRDDQIGKLHTTIKQQITNCDESGFARTLESMVAMVPSNIQIARESYYHSLMLLWMRLVGFEVRGEEPNNLGRSDIVWQQPNLAVVAEIKFHAKKKIDMLLKEAMTQIHEKRYYNKYIGKVLLLGIAFSGKNIGCRMEVVEN
jgi:hypothetical protein